MWSLIFLTVFGEAADKHSDKCPSSPNTLVSTGQTRNKNKGIDIRVMYHLLNKYGFDALVSPVTETIVQPTNDQQVEQRLKEALSINNLIADDH